MKDTFFGKNVSLSSTNINRIEEHMIKTHRGFSRTLNLILNEWNSYKNLAEDLSKQHEKEVAKEYYPEEKKKEVFAPLKKGGN